MNVNMANNVPFLSREYSLSVTRKRLCGSVCEPRPARPRPRGGAGRCLSHVLLRNTELKVQVPRKHYNYGSTPPSIDNPELQILDRHFKNRLPISARHKPVSCLHRTAIKTILFFFFYISCDCLSDIGI